nr:carboxypeptidase-like regulatory domain-containing protein [Deinococcus budaensis]
MQVQASAERTGSRTRFSVGGRFTPSGAVRTPDAVVALFGGRNAGTLRLRAFEDLNRNGARDAGEPGVASRFLVGGQPLSTDAAGEASLLLTPGRYEVGLDGDVLAQFLIPALPAAEVKWRETVSVEVPVRQVGSVQGRLTDEGGRPVVGAEVRLAGAVGEHGAVSDGAGYYRLSGLDFGTYTLTLQADPALYRVPGPAPLTLASGEALLTHDAVLASNAELRGVETEGLSLRVILPEEALPPGTTLPVRVEVDPAAGGAAQSVAAESVVVEGLPTPLVLRNTGGNVWEGTLTLPADQQTPLEVQIVARQGDRRVAEERALLLVDPALPAASLQVAPYNALPGQVLTLRAVVYGAVTRVQVRDAGGRVTDLSAGPGRSYAAELAAPASPGSHTLTLLVDGEPRAEAAYRVLGRP